MDVERGAAWRRRQRRLRSWWRHEQQTVAAVLATVTHHLHSKVGTAYDAPRGQKKVTSTRVGPAEYHEFSSDDGRPTGGERPAALSEPWPQGKMERHDGIAYELVQALDALVLQTVEQLLNVVQIFSTQLPVVAEPVIAVPKILPHDVPPRRLCRDTQLAEQLVEVPTILYFLKLRIPEQIVDNPVPHGGRGTGGGLSGFLPGQYSLTAEQIVDNPVPSWRFRGRFSRFFALFPKIKKVRHNLRTRAHGRRLLMTRPWCLRRRRSRSWRRPGVRAARWALVGVASGTPAHHRHCWWLAACRWVTGWPYDMAASMAHRQWAMVTWLRWCSWAGAWFRQCIHVPASTYCGGASFSPSSKWWILLLFTETGTHSVNCASRRLPCHGAEDVSLGLVS